MDVKIIKLLLMIYLLEFEEDRYSDYWESMELENLLLLKCYQVRLLRPQAIVIFAG